MAEPKKDLFTEEEQSMANFARALSHPARLKILKILNDLNGCIVAEMVERLPLAQSTISQHLEELKKAGLIRSAVEGPKRYYCLNQKVVLKAKDKLNKLFSNICTCC
jgi:DNA-binding transcriptional ArsR family regulator